jgi:hypothetical protein
MESPFIPAAEHVLKHHIAKPNDQFRAWRESLRVRVTALTPAADQLPQVIF